MWVQPFPARFTIEDRDDRTRIVLPSRKVWFVLLFLGVWLVGWACAEVSVLSVVIAGRGAGSAPFLSFWLVGWTLGGAMAFFSLLWQLAGSETIEVTGETLRVWRSIFGLHLPARIYAAEHVQDLRVPVRDAPHPFSRERTNVLLGLGPGAIAFDYGARTIHIAAGADEAEAKLIVAAICQRYPRYRHGR